MALTEGGEQPTLANAVLPGAGYLHLTRPVTTPCRITLSPDTDHAEAVPVYQCSDDKIPVVQLGYGSPFADRVHTARAHAAGSPVRVETAGRQMAKPQDALARQAAAYDQLQARFHSLHTALRDQIRVFGDAVGQILAVLTDQADALAKLAKAAELTGTPIEELMLEGREHGLLTRAGVHTVEQLTDMTEDDLYDLRNTGVKSVAKIKAKLFKEFGLTLKDAAT